VAPAPAERRDHRKEDLNQSHQTPPLVVLTSGEPAGIGPDLCLSLATTKIDARIVVLGDAEMFRARARTLGASVGIDLIADPADAAQQRPGRLQLLPFKLQAPSVPGRPDPTNSRAVIQMLEFGARACLDGTADALVTGPVHKSVINAAGIPFSGHTELLAELTGCALPVMLLASPRLRVALVTTHLPLADVAGNITQSRLRAIVRVVDEGLKRRFRIGSPRILVLGLNPHAGEDGVLGTEEKTTIEPAIAELRKTGIDVTGPVSADSAFTRASLDRCDVVIAMYHDQGLPVLKAQDFGEIVNVTLGLPIIRTSVDHGTALDLAGTGRASAASLEAAVRMAIDMTKRDEE
jgi:4-hydroxythreonine-4-phosphate dehydrogenase